MKDNVKKAMNFFKRHVKDYTDEEVVEIRLIGSSYLPVSFKKFLPEKNIKFINVKQLFFNKNDLFKFKELLCFDDYFILKNFKVCYTLNPRNWKKIKKYNRSGYESMDNVRCLGFDFELKNHSNPSEKELKGLRSYVNRFILNVSVYGLFNPGIIHSGRGFHLLYYTFPQRITDGKKRWYKSLVEYLCEHFEDEEYRVDPLKDFTRVFSLPGSINYKVDKMVDYEKLPDMTSFLFKNREDDFVYIETDEDKITDINNLTEWNLLKTGKIPEGERHQLLVLPLKIWLYENNIKNWKEYETIINKLYKGAESFNPNQFRGAKYKYNKGAVNKWLKKNKKWVKDNNFEVNE